MKHSNNRCTLRPARLHYYIVPHQFLQRPMTSDDDDTGWHRPGRERREREEGGDTGDREGEHNGGGGGPRDSRAGDDVAPGDTGRRAKTRGGRQRRKPGAGSQTCQVCKSPVGLGEHALGQHQAGKYCLTYRYWRAGLRWDLAAVRAAEDADAQWDQRPDGTWVQRDRPRSPRRHSERPVTPERAPRSAERRSMRERQHSRSRSHRLREPRERRGRSQPLRLRAPEKRSLSRGQGRRASPRRRPQSLRRSRGSDAARKCSRDDKRRRRSQSPARRRRTREPAQTNQTPVTRSPLSHSPSREVVRSSPVPGSAGPEVAAADATEKGKAARPDVKDEPKTSSSSSSSSSSTESRRGATEVGEMNPNKESTAASKPSTGGQTPAAQPQTARKPTAAKAGAPAKEPAQDTKRQESQNKQPEKKTAEAVRQIQAGDGTAAVSPGETQAQPPEDLAPLPPNPTATEYRELVATLLRTAIESSARRG